ncbi:glycosyl hydrolase family 61-domain-containing protein [Hypoxylon sp. NC1633]|nr:glycosyl hydrolase family 61-domain-containing protein [Hypoxylon sp. NC1633]
MKLQSSLAAVAVTWTALFELAHAHCYIYSVYVNGVDTGTFEGIRTPAYNGAPPYGYANSPVKDLDSIDMRCNLLGDHQVPRTIEVRPGDNITMEWHHDQRTATDDVIASSHHGPAMVYLSPDPPTESSFVKIWEEGKFAEGVGARAPGKWATTADVAANGGRMNVRIPNGLKAGFYLIRAEMVGLHEAEVSYKNNPIRGAQFYPNCVQIEVLGDGEVELPEGVGFPGAYKWDDPGVIYDVYCSTKTTTTAPCTTTYQIPGPTVWSGAWPDTPSVQLGAMTGVTKATSWNSWIVKSVVTSASAGRVLGTSTYQAQWSTTYHAPTPTA